MRRAGESSNSRRPQKPHNIALSEITKDERAFFLRFVGVVEEPFPKFTCWGDPAAAEYDALSVPQHRIEYFKYKGVKVWDKKSRVDHVFGSSGISGDGVDIVEFMANVDRMRREEEEARIAEAATSRKRKA